MPFSSPRAVRPARPASLAIIALGVALLATAAATAQPRGTQRGEHSTCSPISSAPPPAPGDQQLAQAWLERADRFASRRFDVITDLPRDRAQPLAAHMDVMHDAYRSALGRFSERGGKKRQLWLIDRAEDYVRVIAREFDADVRSIPGVNLEDGSTIALVACIEMTRMPAAPTTRSGGRPMTGAPGAPGAANAAAPDPDSRLLHVLQHEGFHQAQVTMFPNMPVWAAEGVAELFGHAVVVGDAAILGEVPADRLARLQEASRNRRIQPLDAFMKIESDEKIGGRSPRQADEQDRWNTNPGQLYGELRYDQAWALVHMLMYGQGGAYRDELAAFLGSLNRGSSGQGAWATAFAGTPPRSLEPALVGWIDGLTATDMGATVQRLRYLAEGMLAILESEEDPVVPTDFAALRERLTAMKHVGSPATGELTAEAEVFDGDGFALVACGRRLPPCIAATAPGPVQLGVKWQRAGREGLRWTFVWE